MLFGGGGYFLKIVQTALGDLAITFVRNRKLPPI